MPDTSELGFSRRGTDGRGSRSQVHMGWVGGELSPRLPLTPLWRPHPSVSPAHPTA